MSRISIRKFRYGLAALLALAVVIFWLGSMRNAPFLFGQSSERHGVLELEAKSRYSKIKIRKEDDVRTLLFVRDSGEEVIESMVDLSKPYDLLVDYTRYMFISYAFRPKQEKVLIVGLGGGAMVQFLEHYDKQTAVDVVEIDPLIVRVADRYFGVRSGGRVNIFTEDAFEYLKRTSAQYNVIYMDAFLKPAGDTDDTGVPLRLKTIRFYQDIQKKLTADGLVVFNINPHRMIDEDVKTIRDAFPQVYVFELPNAGGLVVVASTSRKRVTPQNLFAAAGELDRRFKTSFSFRDMVYRLER
jgi:spermidine synthase